LVSPDAGLVSAPLQADHLFCDLSTWEWMVQRFGRVHPWSGGDSEICVVHLPEADLDARRAATLRLLGKIHSDASAQAMLALTKDARQDACAAAPRRQVLTDILFDTWTNTSIRGRLPGRPPVAPYLRLSDDEEVWPTTLVAWRDDVVPEDSNALVDIVRGVQPLGVTHPALAEEIAR